MSATNNHHPVTTAPPPRASFDDSFFLASPGGPMTLVSNFFSGESSSEYRSFSELLAGAMVSPRCDNDDGGGSHEKVNDVEGFKERRPMNLVVAHHSPLFTVPPGLSPSCFLNSPAGFFSPQSPFGISHQQALTQVTVQAVLAQPDMQMQVPGEPLVHHPSSTLSEDASEQKVEASNISHAEKKYQLPSSSAIDKPANDGYNWRKYGQKQVKGSEYPRSYYKCTHLNCPVKKKVERDQDGHITEIIYKGQHNHEKPQAIRSVKVNNDSNENASTQPNSEPNSQGWLGNSNKLGESLSDCSTDQTFYQEAPRQVLGSSESQDMCDVVVKEAEGDENEPNPKRRNTDLGISGVPLPKQTVTEAKIVVQTRSEVDILDDGYRWRKYGQKVVKGNPHPRSYYKCTSAGCNVRKHVERASMDPKAVITTYEGKHDHDVPAPRNSSHSTATSNSMPLKVHKEVAEKHPLLKDMEFGNNLQRPVHLRLKEEQIIV